MTNSKRDCKASIGNSVMIAKGRSYAQNADLPLFFAESWNDPEKVDKTAGDSAKGGYNGIPRSRIRPCCFGQCDMGK